MINKVKKEPQQGLVDSKLFDEKSFYAKFIHDLDNCNSEVVIESPFITTSRMKKLTPIFTNLINRGIKVFVVTRDPKEHSDTYEMQSETEIQNFEVLGVQVLICKGNHHRKLAIIDRDILWEGSLNILSQSKSREIMRRIENNEMALEMFNFIRLYKFI